MTSQDLCEDAMVSKAGCCFFSMLQMGKENCLKKDQGSRIPGVQWQS